MPVDIEFKSIWINHSKYINNNNNNIYLYILSKKHMNDAYIKIYDNKKKKTIIIIIQSFNKKISIRFYN